MPIYEYRCAECGKKSTYLILRRNSDESLKCTHCGSSKLVRLMSRFGTVKSEEERLESLADPSSWSGLDENDPKSVEKFVRKMGSQLGDEISREELDQMADEAAREAAKGFSDKEGHDSGGDSGIASMDDY